MTAWLRQRGMTPGRAAIVAVLAIALVAVWGPQLIPSRSNPKPVAAVTASTKSTPTSRPSSPAISSTSLPALKAASTADVASVVKQERRLPKFTATEAGSFDPFAAPDWAPAAVTLAASSANGVAAGNATQRFEAIRSRGVAMILVSPDGKAAQLGDRTVRVGDQVDGFEVIDITSEGVVFMPAASGDTEGVDGA